MLLRPHFGLLGAFLLATSPVVTGDLKAQKPAKPAKKPPKPRPAFEYQYEFETRRLLVEERLPQEVRKSKPKPGVLSLEEFEAAMREARKTKPLGGPTYKPDVSRPSVRDPRRLGGSNEREHEAHTHRERSDSFDAEGEH
jgi:hypothetical protein